MTDHQKIIKAQNKRMPDAMVAVLNPQAWTVARVKDELPDVKVMVGPRQNNAIVTGQVRGRKMDFPRVYFTVNGIENSAEWAWQTIADCLNNDRPLRY